MSVITPLLPQASAAELEIANDVIIKFGADAQLVVRDNLKPGKHVVLTSQKDDGSGGQANQTPQIPVAGNWRGVRFEKSMRSTNLDDWQLRYAGAQGSQGTDAALHIRSLSPMLRQVQITDSVIGLGLYGGASPNVEGSGFLRNETAVRVENSAPFFSGTQFSENIQWAIYNATPETFIAAPGNWWGHASGPKDVVGNPQGQGDAVTTGVDYGNYLSGPLPLNPEIRLLSSASHYEQKTVQLELACQNATEYRLAEGDTFSGAFLPLVNGRVQTSFTFSSGDGRKALAVQFRNAFGVVSAQLEGGVLIDAEAPTVAWIAPAPNSVIIQATTLEASATDASGIRQVRLYLDDGILLATLTSAPFRFTWTPAADTAEGAHTLRVIATDEVGRTNEQSVQIVFQHGAVDIDKYPAKIGSWYAVNGYSGVSGVSLEECQSAQLNAWENKWWGYICPRPGVWIQNSRADYSYNLNQCFNGSSQAGGGAACRATLSCPYGGQLQGDFCVNIPSCAPGETRNLETGQCQTTACAAIAVPQIEQSLDGLTTHGSTLTVTGAAEAGSSVQLWRNGQASGQAVRVGADGRFSAPLKLIAGVNQIQAVAMNVCGSSSPLSARVSVTLEIVLPSSPSALSAQIQAGGKVKLSWSRPSDSNVTGQHVYRASAPFDDIGEAKKIASLAASVTSFEDLPPSDATWTYRIVSVNADGFVSLPSNAVTVISDSTPPKATEVQYVSMGKVDAASGRYGQGRIDVTLAVSEALSVMPYLAIVPHGGAPIPIELYKIDETHYSGSFLVNASTPSGVANALFSARDLVGNRGTEIDAGETLNLDTDGPVLSNIVLTPSTPIRNDTPQTVQAVFTFSKAPVATPQVKYRLSGPGRSLVALNGLSRVDEVTYSASFTLPADAGAAQPENLSFSQEAQDDLDNISTKVSALNRYQVYQGELPPLDAPFGFTVKALPGGKVKLSWQAVEDAESYQIYRQSPEQTALEELTRTAGIEYIDQTPADGLYRYAVASVRQANAQESVSAWGNVLEVRAVANAPGAPQNLVLTLTGQGIYAHWQPPLASEVDYYNLYRAAGTSIDSIEGLTPIKTRIGTPQTYDTYPDPQKGAYVVTAVDKAGNESAISNSAYLNASLLPVRNLRVEKLGDNLPEIYWDAPNGNIAGYLVYVGPEDNLVKLTPDPIAATHLTDTGYTAGERRYTVASVDVNGVEMPRSILLPSVTSQIASGLPVKRGVMNRLQVQLANPSALALEAVRTVVRLPVDKSATQFKDHKSEPITLSASEIRLVPVIVGGYADLPGSLAARVGVEITPQEGALVRIWHDETVTVTDGALVVGITADEFTRGGTGKVKLEVENLSEVEVELLTATGNGANASPELRFKILDAEDNVLAVQPYKQVLGANVITLVNGQTVARIPAGGRYVSDVFNLNIPAASPDSIRVRLEVDKLRYHSGREDEIQIAGRGSERRVSLLEVPYYGEVTDVSPVSSFGDEDIVITGRALDRANQAPLSGTRLKLVFNQQGYERFFTVQTDAAGEFKYVFKPSQSDAGLFKVSAVHPEISDYSEQKSFVINRVTVGPTPYRLDVPRNYPFTIPFTARAGVGTSASNLRLVLEAPSQPTGQIPEGIQIQLPAPVSLTERQTANLPVRFVADDTAQPSGALIFDVISNEQGNKPLGKLRVDYVLSEARPYLTSTPGFVETGLAQGGSRMESVTIRNNGLQEARNLHFTLTRANGTPVPDWVSLGNVADGTLAVGASRTIDLVFSPPAGTQEGVYEFKLNISGDNIPNQALNVYVSVTQSGQGSILFKASDIYTATVDKNGNLIQGLAGATITVQNEDVATVRHEIKTDVLGEAFFQNLPAGYYTFRARASNHQEMGGRLIVKPGITQTQPVFLDYNLITVEWSVREITIEDRYEITLNATFETDVPAAVVVLSPHSINLPKMAAGEIFYGELTLTNYGLIRAENVRQTLPPSNAYFRYEFLAEVPPVLEAKQRVVIPYRIIALRSLQEQASGGNASGGGCYSYSASTAVSCAYTCANGNKTSCGDSAHWISSDFSTCSSGSGGSSGGGGGSSGPWGTGIGGAWSGSRETSLPGMRCVFIPKNGRFECSN